MAQQKNETIEEPTLAPIDKDFGTGVYCNWEDQEEKTVLITRWGQYMKQTDDGERVCFRATVLNIDRKEYKINDKIIEIPDDIEWEIDNYDGIESIHEKHRSW